MTQITAVYEGELRCLCTHEGSGETLRTDAPPDNQGKGEFFSPTDLLATALGTCILTLMGIASKKYQVELKGSTIKVEKFMSTTPPRRIARLEVTVNIPYTFDEQIQQGLERAALSCPVHESLHPETEQKIHFNWGV